MTAPHQGIVHATVLAPDLQAFCVAYITQLAMGVQQQGTLLSLIHI